MGKASRTKVDASRREKIAAQRAAERRAEQRRRILIASGSIIVVIAVAFVAVAGVFSYRASKNMEHAASDSGTTTSGPDQNAFANQGSTPPEPKRGKGKYWPSAWGIGRMNRPGKTSWKT